MGANPYTTPANYEYKPLNIEAFVIPLAKMQEQLDLTTSAVKNADFQIQHLDWAKDPEKAKELLDVVKTKQSEIVNNLAKTKNYTQAAQQITELNKLWQTDPNKVALETNAALWKKRNEEELARVKEGKISRDQYLQWVADEKYKYETEDEYGNVGVSFRASEGDPKGTYRSVTGSTGRLDDLEDELQKVSMEAAGKVHSDTYEGYLESLGIDPVTIKKRFAKSTMEKLPAAKVAQAVHDYLLTLPKYSTWGQEVAGYNFREKMRSENRDAYAEDMVNRGLTSVDQELQNRVAYLDKVKGNKEEDPVYLNLVDTKQSLQNMAETGQYDDKVLQELYTQEHLNKMFDFRALGKLFEFQKQNTQEQFVDIPDEDDGSGDGSGKNADNPFVIGTQDVVMDLGNTRKSLYQNSATIYANHKKIKDLSGGSVGRLLMLYPSGNYMTKVAKDAMALHQREEKLLKLIMNSNSPADLKAKLKSNYMFSNDADVNRVWKDFHNPGGSSALTEYNNALGNSGLAYNNAANNKAAIDNATNAALKDKDFIKAVADLGDNQPEVQFLISKEKALLQGYDLTKQGFTKTQIKGIKRAIALYDVGSYTPEQLKKAKVDSGISRFLTHDEVARLNGHKDFMTAVRNNFDFGYVPYNSGITAKDAYNQLMQDFLKKGTVVNTMESVRVGDSKTANDLKAAFGDMKTVTGYADINLINQPGFDEEGKPLKDTKLDYENGKAPVLAFQNGVPYIKVPYKYKGGEGHLLLPVDKRTETVVQHILRQDNARLAKVNTELAAQTIASNNEVLFTIKHKAITDAEANTAQYEVSATKPEVAIRTISLSSPSGGVVNATIVKKFPSGGGVQPYFVLKYSDGTTIGPYESIKALKEDVGEY